MELESVLIECNNVVMSECQIISESVNESIIELLIHFRILFSLEIYLCRETMIHWAFYKNK